MTPQTAVERFWVQARVEGKLNRREAVIGQNVQDTVPPPVWSTSPDPAQATRDVEELLGSGTLTQVFAMADLDDAEQVPARVGDLGIVLRSGEHTSELQSRGHLVCRLLLCNTNKDTVGE